ncbi:precorrin-6y C5,15-methyltransferase (decarboxylating) subunit CbiE [Dongia rigui]|uniref:Precorrin-6y C5,15-methyltransferase (Decarboxylating) subunit CbiE n=1 Tax=Dongia rigui TaxID=940149 RepID=A0ABU5E058_9PROT|nr:precorrin-6y C5,15-methyltransferase (decarboxylating) subunit CbiE [Dongia rigui]MDY0872848.1 precorrin-6y C5,15-methyltransferase (decarboxylating) subunit CbiE [Dongia rigui]
MATWLTVIGIGEDGLDGLGAAARAALSDAAIVFGGNRHLGMLPDSFKAERRPWPSPFSDAFDAVLALRGQKVAILASGDPMFYGMGASLSRQLSADEMRVISAPSSVSLAAARMGWALQDVCVVTIHGRPIHHVNRALHDGARLIVLSEDGFSAQAVAALLTARGFGPSRITVFEHLGGPKEKRIDGIAESWRAGENAALNLLAIDCRAGPQAQAFPALAGLPDEAFQNDGQLTKRDVRAVTLARLAPLPGELLWDVGAGCGSISIEWMRSHPSCRAIAIEENDGRQQFIRANADHLGVPNLDLVAGAAPAALAGLAQPDAIFIGGGVTEPGVIEACWAALKPGGRLVANAVTVQSEVLLISWQEKIGGELTRIAVSQAKPLGGFDAWRAALPVTIFCAFKPN